MRISWILKAAISIICLLLLIYFIKPEKLLASIMSINLSYLPLVLFLFALLFLLGSLTLYTTLLPIKKISLWQTIKYYLFSWTAGMFSLGKLGELSIIYFLRKDFSPAESSAVFLITKFNSLVSLLILSSLGFFVFFELSEMLFMIFIFGLALVALLWFFLTEKGRLVLKRLLGKHSSIFAGFSGVMKEFLRHHKKIIAVNFIFLMARWLLLALLTMVLFMSFGVNANFFDLLFINSVSTIMAMIPISISGIGVREGSFALLAGRLGYSITIAGSVLAIGFALDYFTAIVLAILFLKEFISIDKSDRHE